MGDRDTVYVVTDWHSMQASADQKKTKVWSWVKVPNRHDGSGYRRVAAHENGVELFAAWVLILQVASRCPVRGVLANASGPLDSLDLSAKTGFPARIFDAAFCELAQPKIAWLRADDWISHADAVRAAVTGGLRTPRVDAAPAGQSDAACPASGAESVVPAAKVAVVPPRTRRVVETKPEPKAGSRFPEFWAAWPKHPRKVNRKACKKVWARERLDAKADEIVAAVEAFKTSEGWRKEGGQFIPAPLVWLNQERWEAAEAVTDPDDGDHLIYTPEIEAIIRAPLTPDEIAQGMRIEIPRGMLGEEGI